VKLFYFLLNLLKGILFEYCSNSTGFFVIYALKNRSYRITLYIAVTKKLIKKIKYLKYLASGELEYDGV
jgi:hypothetical protein